MFNSVLLFRFALKRHRNIHEKYGRTKPNQPSSQDVKEDVKNGENNQNSATVQEDIGQDEHIEIQETKYEQPKYEDTDPSVEIAEEMAEISELQVQLS